MHPFKSLITALLTLTFLCGFFTTSSAQNWLWAKGGSGGSEAESENSTTDEQGNVYITGYFNQGNLKFGSFTLNDPSSSYSDLYLVKYDRSGNVLWAVQSGLEANPQTMSVATDKSGSVYITGTFSQSNISFGTDTMQLRGYQTIFLVKYNSQGHVQWAKEYGGPYQDGPYYSAGNAITVDAYGGVYVCGGIQSQQLVIGPSTLTHIGGAYLGKFDAQGQGLWATSPGGPAVATNVTSDKLGNIYVTGLFFDTITFGNISLFDIDSAADMFLAKYDTGGNVLWATSAATKLHAYNQEEDYINFSTAIDAHNNIYVNGSFQGRQVTFGSTTLTNVYADSGSTNMFLAKYDSSGHALWAKSNTGPYYTYGMGVAVDNFDDAYCVGSFSNSTDVGVQFDTCSITFAPYTIQTPAIFNDPMFVVEYGPDGSVLCATVLPSGGDDMNSITGNGLGDIYVFADYAMDSFKFNDSLYLNTPDGESPFVARFQCGGSTTSSVNDIIAPLELKVYPNPTSGHCNLQFNGGDGRFSAVIFDATGREVMKLFTANNILNYDFNMQSLPAGLYLVQLTDQQGNQGITRLIKE